jgi:hypothetical protein
MSIKFAIFGRMNDLHHAVYFAHELEEEYPNQVVKIATDKLQSITPRDLEVSMGLKTIDEARAFQVGLRPIPVKSFIANYPELEAVLLIQDAEKIYNITGVSVPVDYYHTTRKWGSLPIGGYCRGLFYAYPTGKHIIQDQNPLSSQFVWFKHYLPHFAGNPPFQIKFQDRVKKIHFLGSAAHNDLAAPSLYTQRVDYLTMMYDHPLFDRGEFCSHGEYLQQMSHYQIVLNIPGNDCFLNLRIFEALAQGCVLLQEDNNYLHQPEIGLIDRENCLLFDSRERLYEQLKFIDTEPEALEQIASKGYELFKAKHVAHFRVKEYLKRIRNYSEREQATIDVLQHHKRVLNELNRTLGGSPCNH